MSDDPAVDQIAVLLRTITRLRQHGDLPRARALARMLTSQYSDDPRTWHALVTVAEDADELAHARQRADALSSPAATTRVFRLDHPAAEASPPADISIEESLPPDLPRPIRTLQDEAPPVRRLPLLSIYVVLIVIMLIVLVLILWTRFAASSAPHTTPTPALAMIDPTAVAAAPTAPQPPTPVPPTRVLPEPTATTEPQQPARATPAPSQETPVPLVTPTLVVTPTREADPVALVPGAIINDGDWQATLLRPDHAVVLDGAIGQLQPKGRFVLVLLAVRNNGAVPARIPEELLVIVDDRNARYRAIPPASTAYLNAFGRGLRGDVSQEETVQPGAGLISMPLIFDVPRDVRRLSAYPIGQQSGWSIVVP